MNMKCKFASAALAAVLAMETATSAFAAIIPTTFNDVKPSDWYYGAVDHVVTRGYFNGVGANTFAPNASMSRAMAVTVLARMFADDLDNYTGKTAFVDVPTNAYYAKAVEWAVANGIVGGTSATTFSPDAMATREQISVLFYNAVKAFGEVGTFDSTALNGFKDRGRISSWADTALQWATTNGIINGSGGYVSPQDSTTRAAFATITMNYNTRYPDGTSTPAPDPEPDPTPAPEPAPEPSEDEFISSKEDEINSLLTISWGADAPTRDTDKLVRAARSIASGEIKDVEQALQSVGFNKPIGTIYHDKYTYSRYDAKSYLTTTSSVTQAVNYLKAQENIKDTNAYTDYGIGVYKMNDIQFRVVVVAYKSHPHIAADTIQMGKDWLAEQEAAPVTLANIEQQVVDLTNQERMKAGLAPLKVSMEMQATAHIRAAELQTLIDASHTRPDGSMYFTVFRDVNSALAYTLDGIDYYFGGHGENTAGGPATPTEVVNAWMNSAGHRRNILASNFTHIGVAVVPRYVDGKLSGYYWEMHLLGM